VNETDANPGQTLGVQPAGDPSDVPLAERRPKPKASEIWLRQGFEQASVGFGLLDRAGHHVMVNSAYTELVGRPKSRVIGATLADLLDDQATSEIREWAQSPLQPLTVEATISRPGGMGAEAVVLLSPLNGNGADGHVLVQLVAGDSWPTRRHGVARMAAIAKHVEEFIVTTRADGAITFASASVANAAGVIVDHLMGRQFDELVHPDDAERLAEAMRTSRSSLVEIVVRWRIGDGWAPHRLRITEVRDQLDRLLGLAYVASPTDTTAVQLLADERTHQDELWGITPDAIWSFDLNGPSAANPAARHILGLNPAESLDGLGLLQIFPRWAIERIAKQGVPETRSGRPWTADLALIDRHGDERPVSLLLIGHDHNGSTEHWTAIARRIVGDPSDAELRWAATHDPLTGLPGRVLVYDRLEVALSRSTRTGQRVGLLVLDLDFFDVVNASVGADIADRLLLAISQRLAGSIRPGDTIGRMGDDEFVVLCEHFDHLDDAERFAERLLRTVEDPIQLEGADWFMSMSVGIAVARPDSTTADGLIRSADAAMYRAKELGRGRYVTYSPDIDMTQLPTTTGPTPV
jgi:diguanylate cyclase (GGDEF)-like protein/PAS domain S-box-containing protein